MDTNSTELRAAAERRIAARDAFVPHLVAYVAVNAGLWVIWFSLASTLYVPFPWPLFSLVGWGVGLALHYRAAFDRPISSRESAVNREIERLAGH